MFRFMKKKSKRNGLKFNKIEAARLDEPPMKKFKKGLPMPEVCIDYWLFMNCYKLYQIYLVIVIKSLYL